MAIFFTPGPTNIKINVQAAFLATTLSHRSYEFHELFLKLKNLLLSLTNAENVCIFTGSGTLANDVIAGQLSQLNLKGLVLSNGEFGERLITHSNNFSLDFCKIQKNWGESFYRKEILSIINKNPGVQWLWCVHCETSTGILNDIEMLKSICNENNLLLCLDCISSMGSLPVNLEDVFLASTTSNKGLCAYPGLAMVYHRHSDFTGYSKSGIPVYLNLAEYQQKDGIPFTISSNLIGALHEAIRSVDFKKKFIQLQELSNYLKKRLYSNKIRFILSKREKCFNIITIQLPDYLKSIDVGDKLKCNGYYLNYESEYLVSRNWLQICIMDEITISDIDLMLMILFKALGNSKTKELKTVWQKN